MTTLVILGIYRHCASCDILLYTDCLFVSSLCQTNLLGATTGFKSEFINGSLLENSGLLFVLSQRAKFFHISPIVIDMDCNEIINQKILLFLCSR